MKAKICTKCGIEKDIIYFVKDNRSKSGITPICKKCKRVIDAKWRKTSEGYASCKASNLKHLKSKGFWIKYNGSNKTFNAWNKNKFLKSCKTEKAAEQVIAKHKLREAKRKLKDEKLLHDDYYDTL